MAFQIHPQMIGEFQRLEDKITCQNLLVSYLGNLRLASSDKHFDIYQFYFALQIM